MSRNSWVVFVARFLAGFALCFTVLYFVVAKRPMTEMISAGEAAFGGGQTNEASTLYITSGNIAPEFFREPFETVVFIFGDLKFLGYSTHEENRVGVTISQITDSIKNMKRDISQCLVVVHNHFTPASFTPSDNNTFYSLRNLGFKGIFAIYHTGSGEFEQHKEK